MVGLPSPGGRPAGEHALIVHLGAGRCFPQEDQHRLFCVGTFNGETRHSGLSTGQPGSPEWHTQLEWRLSGPQLRVLESNGAAHCKLVFAREDGRSVGWVVLDLRTARLNARHASKSAWWAVAGPFKGREAPEVQLHLVLLEPAVAQLPHQQQPSAGIMAALAPEGRFSTGAAAAQLATPALNRQHQAASTISAAWPPQAASAADVQLLQQVGAVSQGMLADGSLRRFDFGVDLRQFSAGRRLPLNLASVVVQLSLPPEFAGLILQSNGRLPPRLAPLRTQPPVDVARGCEAALPGSQASVQFTAGLMSLATLLARNPVMTVEVWHKERLAEDTLLGQAHIPLAPLLQESWVDGRAGVFTMVPAADGSGQQERVQVGTLHLVMSLEEAGPAAQEPPPAAAPSPRRATPRKPQLQQPSSLAATPRYAADLAQPSLPAQPQLSVQQAVGPITTQPGQQGSEEQSKSSLADGNGAAPPVDAPLPSATPSTSGQHAGSSGSSARIEAAGPSSHDAPGPTLSGSAEQQGAPPAPPGMSRGHPCSLQHQPATVAVQPPVIAAGGPAGAAAAAAETSLDAAGPGAQPATTLEGLVPEIEAAWELEMWKRAQEEQWRAELKRQEAERMSALEAEWRRREGEREAEQAALRQELAALQATAQQVLAAAEERESKVVAAEEGVARRRRELEREHAARVGEAEGAVRRVQMEFEHQLELERLRTRQLQQQAVTAEERASAADSRAAAAERALQELKEQHARSPVGLLERQLGEARAALAEAEQRASRAGEAKRKYKEQVVRLAQEVSTLQRHLAEVVGLRREQLDAELARVAAQEAALAARRGAGELGALRQQLQELQLGGGAGGAAGGGSGKAAAAQEGPLLLGEGAGSEEVQRLLQEREALLVSGAYAREDPLIQQLDNRISRLGEPQGRQRQVVVERGQGQAAAAAGALRAAAGGGDPVPGVVLAQA